MWPFHCPFPLYPHLPTAELEDPDLQGREALLKLEESFVIFH